MGTRRTGRILAFQSLYRYDMTGQEVKELLDFSWMEDEGPQAVREEAVAFAALLIQGTVENLERIDEEIRRHLQNWDFSRLGRVDLAILRISVYALLFQPSIPHSVTIDEAVELAREFGTDDSYRFVNGVLDAVRKHNVQDS